MIGETVTAWRAGDGTGELRGTVARLEEASDAARGVPRRDGRADSLAPAGGADRVILSQIRARSPTAPAWGDAARAPCAVVLQPQRPRHGGPAPRRGVGEALRGARLSGALPDETTVLNFPCLWAWGDAGYPGAGKREENRDAEADGQVTMKAGKLRRLDKAGAQEAAARRKATVRAKVEHPLL